jgi:hypothetical protein
MADRMVLDTIKAYRPRLIAAAVEMRANGDSYESIARFLTNKARGVPGYAITGQSVRVWFEKQAP